MERVRVRPAEARDREDVWRLLGQLAISRVPDRVAFEPSFDALLADGSALVLIADDGGAAVGYLVASLRPTLIANGPEVWVGELVVDEAARGRGIGTALTHAAEEWAVGLGARQVTLATSRAQPFYETLGYRPTATYLKKSLEG